jgi:predicted nucleic acid-binding protein
MIVVDTSVWIDWLNDRDTAQTDRVASVLVEDGPIALTDVVLAEVLQGIRDRRQVRRVDEVLSAHEVLRLESLDDFRQAAELYRACRRRGATIRRTTDCLIAAVCVREALPLLHADADFDQLAAHTALQVVLSATDS